MNNSNPPEGILLLNKPVGKTSFHLVAILRKRLGVKKIGHSGTLDPFATGVMVMLVGRNYTRLSDQFLTSEKEYRAKLMLGVSTDTFDCDGQVIGGNKEIVPTQEDIQKSIQAFQGDILQVPPMFSAKKINGKKLYELARKGETIEREAVKVNVKTTFLNYNYPYLELEIVCSKGTYIRSIAHDLGEMIGCGAHLVALERTRSGQFHINECMDIATLDAASNINLREHLKDVNSLKAS